MEKGREFPIRTDVVLGFGDEASKGSLPPAGRRLELALERLLTLREVAELLQVSEKTVRRLVASRALPCVRFGGVLRFQQADLFRFVAARKG